MTIDEAIKKCNEEATRQESIANSAKHLDVSHESIVHCKRCATEHRQLAEWLTELKNRREVSEIEKRSIEKCDKCSDILDCPLYYPWLKE